jgi:ABC-2 type transport system permease protein
VSGLIRDEARGAVLGIIRRDLTVVRRSRAVVLPILLVPLIMFVALPVAVTVGLRVGHDQLAELAPLIELLPENIRRQLGDGLEQQLLAYLIEFQFATLFLIVPLLVAAVIAADSFAGEKERKTMEALLYSPTTDRELYIAKLAAPFIVAVGVGVLGFLLFAISANLAAGPTAGRLLGLTPLWLTIVLWLGPAVAAVGVGTLVIVSARVRGFQEAYQLGGLVVMPIVLLMVAQFTGVLFLDWPVALILGAIVWLVAGAVLWVGFGQFRRERLLLSS